MELYYVGVCGGQRCTRTDFSATTLCAFPVNIIPPTLHTHSFIHLPPTLYNVFLPALQFPLSVPFHQCSILIHSSTTHAV